MANGFLDWLRNIFSSENSGENKSNTSGSAGDGKKGSSMAKKKGISVHIGINLVDPNHYRKADGTGWDGKLNACEFDAKDMTKIAQEHGFESQTILTKEATRKKIRDTFKKAAKTLKPGDMFLVSYSGHGGFVHDFDGDEAELTPGDQYDETWCLYDGQIIDDELNDLYNQFDPGVRVLIFSDSCHSGTVSRDFGDDFVFDPNPSLGAPRAMPPDNATETLYANVDFYKAIDEEKTGVEDVQTPRILFSGCQDKQLSRDGMLNGRFTDTLKKVLKEGDFANYSELHQKILAKMPEDQTPNYLPLGQATAFEAQRPFQI